MKLSEYLKKNNIKASHFADNADIPVSVISKHLSGKGVSLETADKIIRKTSGMVSLSDLIDSKNGNGTPPTSAPPPPNGD